MLLYALRCQTAVLNTLVPAVADGPRDADLWTRTYKPSILYAVCVYRIDGRQLRSGVAGRCDK